MANRFLIVGVAALGIAMTAAVMLVCDLWFTDTTVAVVVALLAGAFAWFWFGLPLTRRAAIDRKR